MRRRKQVIFYCLMVLMTLAVIEGMAQAAYYIAYGEFNAIPPALPPENRAADAAEGRPLGFARIDHPYYGYTRVEPGHPMNQAPPPRRSDGAVLIALVGGSVGLGVTEAFRYALGDWFRDNDIPLRPIVLGLANNAVKQPQQVMMIANTLSLGGEYDIIVNLDGYNELATTHESYFDYGVSPFYPFGWQQQQAGLADAQKLLVSRIYALRQREQRLSDAARARPGRWSALYGMVNRYLRENAAAQILLLNRELAAASAPAGSGEYGLHRYGPALAAAPDAYGLSQLALRVWYRSSILLADLARAAGAEYYHFQQPNQYAPGAKPLSDRERAYAYNPEKRAFQAYQDAYPLWQRLGAELRRQGVNYYDLTPLFADRRETLYKDDCCHLNERGYALLAESMVQRLAPALRNRVALARAAADDDDAALAAATGPALYPATYETTIAAVVNKLYFDVRRTAAGALLYSRDDCRPADTAAPFYLRVTPADAADLTPGRAAGGGAANRYDFAFDEVGGRIDADGRCRMEYQLPDYAIADVRTGQYRPETGQPLWQAGIALDVSFAVQLDPEAGVLRYSRADCAPIHTAADFFLHITPADAADLTPRRAAHGYDNYDFEFRYNGGAMDAGGGCAVASPLPEYDIASISTGQYIRSTGQWLWETRIDFDLPGP